MNKIRNTQEYLRCTDIAGDGFDNKPDQAFTHLYNRYNRRMFLFALSLTGLECVSEDIVQDVFLKVWEKRNNIKTINNFESYLYVLTRNFANSFWRKEAVKRKYWKQSIWDSSEDTVFRFVVTRETSRHLHKCVDTLPSRHKLVFQLRHEANLKLCDIAATMSISRNTVKAHLRATVQHIRKRMRQVEHTKPNHFRQRSDSSEEKLSVDSFLSADCVYLKSASATVCC